MSPVTFTWGEDARQSFEDLTALEACIRSVASNAERPLLAELRAEGHAVMLGLGRDDVVLSVHGDRDEEGIATEWMAVGDSNRIESVDFWILGDQHSEFEARRLIPFDVALAATIKFLKTRKLPQNLSWEENSY